MTALFAVGPLNTASAGRSLLLNAFVASFICFFVYYATSFSAVDVTKGALKLRGNELEGKNYPGELESDRDPQVVWIMSFGGSGTSYTITNIERITGTATATNYASDIHPNVPVRFNLSKSSSGPFLHHPGNRVPRFVLTKTHCGGYCMDCGVSSYFNKSLSWFEEQCRTGEAWGGKVVVYDEHVRIAKAVHLIRNPFDNLVGRMHLGSAHRQSRGERGFNHSQLGLEEWCEYLDGKYQEQDHSTKVLDMALPCHAEWYRYILWHNHAVEVTEKVPQVYHMHYEDYTSSYTSTVEQLLAFLELEQVNAPLHFEANKTYLEYFSMEHRQRAARFVRRLASNKAWKLLARYFEPYLIGDAASPSQSQQGEPLDDDDQMVTDSGSSSSDLPGHFSYNQRSEVTWLMSFPNSGTSYTITNTEKMSKRSTATNYAEDFVRWVPVRPELHDGPYLHDLNLPLAKYTLTKTHCGGYCTDCAPRSYVRDLDEFENDCLSGQRKEAGHVVTTRYHSSVPAKAIHLIRNPFDNIVARMHLAVKKRRQDLSWDNGMLDAFENSEAGIHAWCKFVDGLFPAQEVTSSKIASDVYDVWKGVPCRSEWYRWVQWHNRALQLTARLRSRRQGEFPVKLLYYEDYSTNYSATVEALFDFLELEMEDDPIEFIPGKTYIGYFSAENQRRAARFVKFMATPECWELVKHYFEGMVDS